MASSPNQLYEQINYNKKTRRVELLWKKKKIYLRNLD